MVLFTLLSGEEVANRRNLKVGSCDQVRGEFGLGHVWRLADAEGLLCVSAYVERTGRGPGLTLIAMDSLTLNKNLKAVVERPMWGLEKWEQRYSRFFRS